MATKTRQRRRDPDPELLAADLPVCIPPDDLWEFLTESLDLGPQSGRLVIPTREARTL